MRVYRFFAYLIAVEVVIQAMAIAFALSGLSNWINNDGGTLTKAVIDEQDAGLFLGVAGFPIHGINGFMIIPLISLIFLITSFFAKFAGATRDAAIVLLLVVIQVVLGVSSGDSPLLGPLHALNAFAILFLALGAAKRASESAEASAPATV